MAEGAALLLVGEHAVKGRHVRCKVRDVFLGVIDHREALVELLQALERVLPARRHRLAEMMGYRIEPFIDGAVELGLPIRQHVAHALDAHSRFRLEAGKLGDALLERLAMTTAQRVHPQRDRACYGRHGDNNQEHAKGGEERVHDPGTLQ